MTGYLSPRDLEAAIGLSRETIRRKCRSGDIPAVKLPNGHYRISREDAEAMLTPVPATTADMTGDDRHRRQVALFESLSTKGGG